MDSTTVLRACIHAGLTNAVFYAIFDPESLDAMFQAGINNEVHLQLGGKTKIPEMPSEETEPLDVIGTVVALRKASTKLNIGDNRLDGRMGAIQVSQNGCDILVCVVSKHEEPNNQSVFTKLGIDFMSSTFLILKSRVHWQNSKGFGPIYKAVVELDGHGVCTSDYSKMHFKHLRRPIFPLEDHITLKDVLGE